jgi:ribosomal-protein-alanine N-acetyltransferase
LPHLDALTLHAADPARLATFWSAALDLPIDPGDAAAIAAGTLAPDESVLLGQRDGLHLWIAPADELAAPGGRLHLEVRLSGTEDLGGLIALGARHRWDDPSGRWSVLEDPEGNVFCAIPSRPPQRQALHGGGAVSDLDVRLLRADDVGPLAALYSANRDHLAPFEPTRDEEFFTVEGQQRRAAALLTDLEEGRAYPYVIEVDGALVGRVNVTNVSRGPFCSGSLGFWVAASHTGRGVATAAVGHVLTKCFGEHGLHRVEAATLVDNAASQAVLRHHGFALIGRAPQYLRIAGEWRDHLLFQRILTTP